MKIRLKTALTLILSLLVFSTQAQKKDIQSAKNRLRDGEYSKALEFINAAFETGKVDQSAEAWQTKFLIYDGIRANQPDLDPDAKQKAYDALVQMLSINPKYDLVKMAQKIDAYVNAAYSDGVTELGDKDLKAAVQDLQNFNDLYKVTRDNLYKEAPILDTINAQATLYKGYGFAEDGDDAQATTIYESLLDDKFLNPTDRQSLFSSLVKIYGKNGNDAKVEALFDKAQKEMPNNEFVITEQINYYSSKGESDKLLKKLDEALASDPNNSTYNYYKGILLSNLAFPAEGEAPENAKELAEQASASLETAAKLDPGNPSIEYMQGFVYYNEAIAINSQLATAPDSEVSKLQRERAVYFQKALPFMENAMKKIQTMDPSELDQATINTANNIGIALKSIYGVDNQTDKLQEVDAFTQKYVK